MNSLARGRFFKTVFATELTSQMKSLLTVLSFHNVCYQFAYRPKKKHSDSRLILIIS